jgi:hypothetical protein
MLSAKNLLSVDQAGFLKMFGGPPGQHMKFEDKPRFVMLRGAHLYVYKTREDDAPLEVIPLRCGAVKIISGIAVSPLGLESPAHESPAHTPRDDAPPAAAAAAAAAPAPSSPLKHSPPRDSVSPILSSLKTRRMRRGSLSSSQNAAVLSSLGHSSPSGSPLNRSLESTKSLEDDPVSAVAVVDATAQLSRGPAIGGGSCVFAVFAPCASRSFLCEHGPADMQEWVSAISRATTRLLNETLEEAGIAPAPSADADTSQSVRAAGGAVLSEVEVSRRFAALRRQAGNDVCADCAAADTSWVLSNWGALICIDCSGVHRQMGVTVSKVRSEILDQWSEAALLFLERSGGNASLNAFLCAKSKEADRDRKAMSRKDFLRRKYVDQAYVSGKAPQPERFVETFA